MPRAGGPLIISPRFTCTLSLYPCTRPTRRLCERYNFDPIERGASGCCDRRSVDRLWRRLLFRDIQFRVVLFRRVLLFRFLVLFRILVLLVLVLLVLLVLVLLGIVLLVLLRIFVLEFRRGLDRIGRLLLQREHLQLLHRADEHRHLELRERAALTDRRRHPRSPPWHPPGTRSTG